DLLRPRAPEPDRRRALLLPVRPQRSPWSARGRGDDARGDRGRAQALRRSAALRRGAPHAFLRGARPGYRPGGALPSHQRRAHGQLRQEPRPDAQGHEPSGARVPPLDPERGFLAAGQGDRPEVSAAGALSPKPEIGNRKSEIGNRTRAKLPIPDSPAPRYFVTRLKRSVSPDLTSRRRMEPGSSS